MLELGIQKTYPNGYVLKTESIDGEYCFVLYDGKKYVRRIWNTHFPIGSDTQNLKLGVQKYYPNGSVLTTESINGEYYFVLCDGERKLRRIWNTHFPISDIQSNDEW